MKFLSTGLVAATALLALAAFGPGVGTAQAQQAGLTVQFAPHAPPPLRREAIPRPPHEFHNAAWQSGRWNWDGHSYVWMPGHYVEAPRVHARWVEGHWKHGHNGYGWEEGHWR